MGKYLHQLKMRNRQLDGLISVEIWALIKIKWFLCQVALNFRRDNQMVIKNYMTCVRSWIIVKIYSNPYQVNTNIPKTHTQKEGVKVISSVAIS